MRSQAKKAKALFEAGAYQDYLFVHGFSVEMTEALAEYWHKRMRQMWGIAGKDATEIRKLFQQGYQGARYSFGYPACPDLADRPSWTASWVLAGLGCASRRTSSWTRSTAPAP